MPDDELRQLERDALSGDETARLRVARGAARSRQMFSVLERLPLRTAPAGEYAHARGLCDAIWTEHLRELAPATRVAGARGCVQVVADPDGAFVAWSEVGAGGGGSIGPRFARADTGELVAPPLTGSVERLEAHRGRLFASMSRIDARLPGQNLVEIAWTDGRPAIRADATQLIGLHGVAEFSPDGRFVRLAHMNRAGVYRWPGLEPVIEAGDEERSWLAASVRWPEQELVAEQPLHEDFVAAFLQAPGPTAGPEPTADLTFIVTSFAGREVARIATSGLASDSARWSVLGDRIALHGRGLRLVDRSGRATTLVRAPGGVVPSLASDGRSIRAVVSRRAEHFTFDSPAPLDAPAHRLTASGLWHPHADLVWIRRYPAYELLVPGVADPVHSLGPGLHPVAWMDEGRALVVLRDARRAGPEVTIEIWR